MILHGVVLPLQMAQSVTIVMKSNKKSLIKKDFMIKICINKYNELNNNKDQWLWSRLLPKT